MRNRVVLNDAGQMIERFSRECENKYPYIRCNPFVCMPTHVHFIIIISADINNVGADVGAGLCVCPRKNGLGAYADAPLQGTDLGAGTDAPLQVRASLRLRGSRRNLTG
ncbi:MAG: hypothetical protein ACRCTY_04760 [Candidatus Adiutrix sp.]